MRHLSGVKDKDDFLNLPVCSNIICRRPASDTVKYLRRVFGYCSVYYILQHFVGYASRYAGAVAAVFNQDYKSVWILFIV